MYKYRELCATDFIFRLWLTIPTFRACRGLSPPSYWPMPGTPRKNRSGNCPLRLYPLDSFNIYIFYLLLDPLDRFIFGMPSEK